MDNTIIDINITTWNCRGLRSGEPYLSILMSDCDIMALTEHHLYHNQLYMLQEINPIFNAHGKSSNKLKNYCYGSFPGSGGVALL